MTDESARRDEVSRSGDRPVRHTEQHDWCSGTIGASTERPLDPYPAFPKRPRERATQSSGADNRDRSVSLNAHRGENSSWSGRSELSGRIGTD